MKLVVFTIVKNGMPFIPTIFFNLQATNLDWRWIVAEGAAKNTHCTAWCNQQEPGISTDGTSEFLDMISKHPRVTILRKEIWDGKVEMCNACLAEIKEPCVLIQMDSDELWRSDAIEKIVQSFRDDSLAAVGQVTCRYFLGVNIVATSKDGYGNKRGEWLRIWRFTPGDKFNRHEPPMLAQQANGHYLNPYWLTMDGITFDHYAWWCENQAAYKEQFYGYHEALASWVGLQKNLTWPVSDLRKFLPWVGPNASADKLSC
jgi:Glycosyl transferase family 2